MRALLERRRQEHAETEARLREEREEAERVRAMEEADRERR